MVITTGGNVGIGTTSPGTFRLAVEGKIGAREVVVTSSSPWPDYVFHKAYKLLDLNEVEKYINQYKHLPNIPSATEVADNGVELGTLNAKLLEKIEEITLYLIEIKKENEALKQRMSVMEKK